MRSHPNMHRTVAGPLLAGAARAAATVQVDMSSRQWSCHSVFSRFARQTGRVHHPMNTYLLRGMPSQIERTIPDHDTATPVVADQDSSPVLAPSSPCSQRHDVKTIRLSTQRSLPTSLASVWHAPLRCVDSPPGTSHFIPDVENNRCLRPRSPAPEGGRWSLAQ